MESGIVLGALVVVAGCDWSDRLGPGGSGRGGLVPVGGGVSIEYRDYGGQGERIVLLPGLGNSVEIFDGFAARLTRDFRVMAIGRRGFGRSSQPVAGYDLATRAKDLAAAMERLGWRRASLVGHSVAGDEMARLAADRPELVDKLIYLDAAYDRVELADLLPFTPVPPSATEADLRSPEAYAAYLQSIYGVRWPNAEITRVFRFGSDGRWLGPTTPPRVYQAILAAAERPNYGAARAPSLAIYAVAERVTDLAPWLTPASPGWQDAMDYLTQGWQPYTARQRDQFRAVGAVIERPGARHYLFLSDPAAVTEAIIAFLKR